MGAEPVALGQPRLSFLPSGWLCLSDAVLRAPPPPAAPAQSALQSLPGRGPVGVPPLPVLAAARRALCTAIWPPARLRPCGAVWFPSPVQAPPGRLRAAAGRVSLRGLGKLPGSGCSWPLALTLTDPARVLPVGGQKWLLLWGRGPLPMVAGGLRGHGPACLPAFRGTLTACSGSLLGRRQGCSTAEAASATPQLNGAHAWDAPGQACWGCSSLPAPPPPVTLRRSPLA